MPAKRILKEKEKEKEDHRVGGVGEEDSVKKLAWLYKLDTMQLTNWVLSETKHLFY